MTELEMKAVAGLAGTGVPYAYAVKAGPWLFLTGHEAFDFDTGSIRGYSGSARLSDVRPAPLPPRG